MSAYLGMSEGINSKILKKMRKVDVGCANWFEENGFKSDEDFRDLCFEFMSEVVKDKGIDGIKRRCKVWYIIKKYNNVGSGSKGDKRVKKIKFEDEQDEACSGPSATNLDVRQSSPLQDVKVENKFGISLPEESSSSSNANIIDPKDIFDDSQSNISSHSDTIDSDLSVSEVAEISDNGVSDKNSGESIPASNSNISSSQLVSPVYQIYVDKDIEKYSQSTTMPPELKHRLIRSTVSNMVAVSHEKNQRLPSTPELHEMAKSLVLKYKPLNCNESSVNDVFTKLKKRIYNMNNKKTSDNGSSSKRKVLTGGEDTSMKKRRNVNLKNAMGSNKDEKNDDLEVFTSITPKNESVDHQTKSQDEELLNDCSINERHINALKKELKKKTLNLSSIEFYLDKSFEYRRKELQSLKTIDERVALLDVEYSCFKDCSQVVLEAKRIVGIPSSTNLVETFHQEMETLIYYFINTSGLRPPTSPKKEMKMIYIMKNISQVFHRGEKKKTCATSVIYEIEDYEEPDKFTSRINAKSHPIILYDKDSVYIMFKKKVLCSTKKANMVEAAIAYFAYYYMLDLDYPHYHEASFTVIQNLVFQDQRTPKEVVDIVNGHLSAYNAFKLQ